MINLIWAMDVNNLIGNGNKLPWRYKEDLIYFKRTVENKTVLMGYLTYLSLKSYYKEKPFPYGKIFVCSLEKVQIEDSNVIIINDVVSFLKNYNEELFVIGGLAIYKLALPYANNLYITHIKNAYKGNVYFPKLDFSRYKIIYNKETKDLIFRVYQKEEGKWF